VTQCWGSSDDGVGVNGKKERWTGCNLKGFHADDSRARSNSVSHVRIGGW